MRHTVCILLLVIASACRSVDVSDGVRDSAKAVTAAPVLVPAVSYVGARGALQKSAIATRLPAGWYSREISGIELKRRMNRISKIGKWEYMGTKNGWHFISLTEISRKIYRIHEKEFEVKMPFSLTANRSKWRRLRGLPEKPNDEETDRETVADEGAIESR